jgi:hypothetical protein
MQYSVRLTAEDAPRWHKDHKSIGLGLFEFDATSMEDANQKVEDEARRRMDRLCPSFSACSFEWIKEPQPVVVVVPSEIVNEVQSRNALYV